MGCKQSTNPTNQLNLSLIDCWKSWLSSLLPLPELKRFIFLWRKQRRKHEWNQKHLMEWMTAAAPAVFLFWRPNGMSAAKKIWSWKGEDNSLELAKRPTNSSLNQSTIFSISCEKIKLIWFVCFSLAEPLCLSLHFIPASAKLIDGWNERKDKPWSRKSCAATSELVDLIK